MLRRILWSTRKGCDCHQMYDDTGFNGNLLGQMSRTKIDFDTVRKIALRLPDVEESSAWGSSALKVRGQWLAVIPTHKSAESNSLAVRVDFEQRTELLESAPDIYYLKDRKSTRLNSSHVAISYAVFCLKKKKLK